LPIDVGAVCIDYLFFERMSQVASGWVALEALPSSAFRTAGGSTNSIK
jgi:hypothetical protein